MIVVCITGLMDIIGIYIINITHYYSLNETIVALEIKLPYFP